MPDARTRDRQKYCSKAECKGASKAQRQRRWLSKPENRDYFRGPENVRRVEQWRKAHPKYWQRKRVVDEDALQEDLATEDLEDQGDNSELSISALQDDCLVQPALVVGLIANLTGSALQDDIAIAVRRIHAYGQRILGMWPGSRSPAEGDDRQTRIVFAASAADPPGVRLGGPPAGAP